MSAVLILPFFSKFRCWPCSIVVSQDLSSLTQVGILDFLPSTIPGACAIPNVPSNMIREQMQSKAERKRGTDAEQKRSPHHIVQST